MTSVLKQIKDSMEKYLYEYEENTSHEIDSMIEEKNDTVKNLDKEIGLLDRVVTNTNKVGEFMVTVCLWFLLAFLSLLYLKLYFRFVLPVGLNVVKIIIDITLPLVLNLGKITLDFLLYY